MPKFGILLASSFLLGEGKDVGMLDATVASILSAPCINPIRMIEKQQRVNLKTTGKEKPIMEIRAFLSSSRPPSASLFQRPVV